MGSAIDGMFDTTFNGLQRALDLYKRRNEALVSNVSNAETPGYRSVDMTFAGELERAFHNHQEKLAKTNPAHLDIQGASSAHLIPDLSGVTKADGNNVDLDLQMGKMVKNAGEYSRAANLVYKKLSILRNAIMRTQS